MPVYISRALFRRLLPAALGVALAWWGLSAPSYRDHDGYLVAAVILPLAAAMALLILGLSQDTRWSAAGRWFSVLVVGQGAALTLIDAPNRVSYQHYRLGDAFDLGALALPLVVVIAQAVVVGVALRAQLPPPHLRTWWRTSLRPWERAVLASVFILTSATLSRSLGVYGAELVVATAVQLTAVGTLLLVARALPGDGSGLERLLGEGGRGATTSVPRAVEPFSIALAIGVTLVSALLAVYSYERHPHVPDEVVYLLQARYLAAGHLTLPLPPVAEAFNIDLMYYDANRWFSPVNPGWPFVLAVGAWLGAPWLVNPVLGGVCVLLVNGLLAELYPTRTRRLSLLLLAASPWFLFMSMNYMTHQWTMTCAIAAALAVARARRLVHRRHRLMFVGGLMLGGVALTRPLEGLAAALVLGSVSLAIQSGRLRFSPSVALVAGSVVSGALVRPYNAYLTGSASYFPIMAFFDKYYAKGSNDLGFGANRGLGWNGLDPFPGHGPIDVLVNTNLNTFQLNIELFGWGMGSLGIILLALLSRRLRRPDWVMAGAILVVSGIHALYWFAGGPDFGARYWYLVLVPCVVLAARSAEELGSSLARRAPTAPARTHLTILAASLAALLVFVPWRAIGKYHNFRNMRPDIRLLDAAHHFGRSIVFIRGERHPDYMSAAIYNPLDLTADAPVYAWDVSPAVRRKVLEAYPDRPAWFVDGTTVTGGRYRLRAGPVPPGAALSVP